VSYVTNVGIICKQDGSGLKQDKKERWHPYVQSGDN